MGKKPAPKLNRRNLLKQSAAAAAFAAGLGAATVGCRQRARSRNGDTKRVIVIGIDGMDPRLSQSMMAAGLLPHFDRLRRQGGFRPLGTTIPPQSPVAWASFINGAGPGSHGIFDFIHRHPEQQCVPFFAGAETLPGKGTVLRRQGIPFWDYLDERGVPSTFYDLPSDYPPSPSKHGHHRCLAGMGTPDMLGTYGTYQHFAEDGPAETTDEAGGKRSGLLFDDETAKARLEGPQKTLWKEPRQVAIDFLVHRDRQANAAVIELPDRKVLLKAGQWSDWLKLDFGLVMAGLVPERVTGICRFFLQQVAPNFRLYATPINIDPSNPAVRISEPNDFIQQISDKLGLFYTTGFQEDHKAFSNGVFTVDEFVAQAEEVLRERLRLLDHAMEHYDDGLLFFYFSSSDLQAHMLWWDSDANPKHPTRSPEEAKRCFGHVRDLYQRLDKVVGQILDRYGERATIFVMSDHGFANFGRQFSLNSWLRKEGYLGPPDCRSIMADVDWLQTRAYGLGINGLYLNMKERERDGIVAPGEREGLLTELVTRLEAVRDVDGQRVIRHVYRADKAYAGSATRLAPDLVVGYNRGYRASWATCLGGLTDAVLLDNDSAWSADHCADAGQLPGVLFCNCPVAAANPSLVDIAPSILAEFGVATPSTMEGKSVFTKNV